MHDSAHSKFTFFLFTALLALVIFATPTRAQSSGDAPDGSSQNQLQSLRPTRLLLAPPTYTLPTTSVPGPGEPTEAGNPNSAPPQGGAANLANRVSNRDRRAPRREDRTAINLGNKHINAIFNGFEQGAGIGFGIELTTADSVPGVEFRFTLLTSTRLYRRFEGTIYVPKLGSENTHAEFWFSYQRRTKDPFYGLGPRSNFDDRTNYDLESRDVEGLLFHNFSPRFQAGVYLGRQSIDNYRGQNEDEPAIDVLFSKNPAVNPITRFVPGLRDELKLFNYGAYFEYDARNNDVGLTKGGYLYARLGSVDGFDDKPTGDYGWIEGTIDARGYIPLGSDKTSFAIRGMADLKSPKGGSQIPYFAQGFLGGRSFVRGFNNFRFRAHNLLLYAAELRQTVFAPKEDRGADVVFFGDVGRNWGDTRSKTNPLIIRNDVYGEAPWRAAYGFAIQYRHTKSVGIRIDYAHSPEKNLLYFSVSRGF
jgi:outer membrane protein assembly factor BamA